MGLDLSGNDDRSLGKLDALDAEKRDSEVACRARC